MLRKYLRRVLPSHGTIRDNRYIARFGTRLQHHNLWHLHRRSVAGGVAVGLFAGLIPGSNPVQFTGGALLAVALKVNLPISVLVTLYSNPFTILPLYFLAFKLGQLLMFSGNSELPSLPAEFSGTALLSHLPEAFNWVISVGKPLLLGLPLLATILAAIGYFVTDWAWRMGVCYQWRVRARKRARRAPRAE
ncbi:MAG: DUF2062 domain-containing protein [Betaproteobacteria bacterium]|nr:DUF2062 domain-containing protein [Betaproteobacteria bacterium]